MSFGGSQWCRPTPSDEHQSMDWNEHRSTSDVQHRSTESVALCEMVRIMTHDEFAAKHPHPPKPFHVNINRKSEQTADRQRELTADQQPTLVLDRRAPLCYLVQLTKINLARLYALRNPSQPSETPTDNIKDDLWHVSKEEKLQERDFDVKSSMSFGGSHWCRPTPSDEHQSMDWDEHRSTLDVQHRSTESVALCKMVRIMTHDEFAAKHPHPPKPFHVNINRKSEQTADRERELTADQQPTLVLDRRAPLCYRVQLPKINLAQLYALRNPSQPSETPTDNISFSMVSYGSLSYYLQNAPKSPLSSK
ncbi:hypothetical protein DY000_02058675 [Brassica cretica]|uniref:Uncharacterized protein n=1 Tax=Brassica cretica TaxID=69181 RepID=A0ABQ7AUF6_BRACR|nr:hypothetical protein DY000_02058675 [Brassica cretica]